MKSFCGSGLYCSTSIGPSVSVTCSRAAAMLAGSRTSAVKPLACTPSCSSSAASASRRPWCREIEPDGEAFLAEAAGHGSAEALSCSDDRESRHTGPNGLGAEYSGSRRVDRRELPAGAVDLASRGCRGPWWGCPWPPGGARTRARRRGSLAVHFEPGVGFSGIRLTCTQPQSP